MIPSYTSCKKTWLPVFFGTAALLVQSDAAPYTSGDLLMGFVTGTGQGANDTLVVRLGTSASFRNSFDGSTNNLNFLNIGPQLTTTFGADWHARTDLYISIFGSTASDTIGDTLVNQDPFRTIYVSRSRNATGSIPGSARSTAWTQASNTAITQTSSQIVSTSGTYSLAPADASGVAIIAKSEGNTLDEYTKPLKANSFTNLSGGIEALFTDGTPGIWGTFGDAGEVEAALDLYRLQAVNNVPGQYGAASPVRSGVYKGSFTINKDGKVSFVAAGAAPADGFNTWAVSKGLPNGVATTDDRDLDGITALLEYALNLNPLAFDSLPPAVASAGGAVLSFTKGSQAAADAKISYLLEQSTTLESGWTTLPATVNNSSIISGLLTAGDPSGRLFGRLKIIRIP